MLERGLADVAINASRRALPALPLAIAAAPTVLRGLLDQEGVPWREHSRQPLAGRFVIFDSVCAAPPELAPGQIGIDLRDAFDPTLRRKCAALARERSVRTAWRVGPLTPFEEVAECDRRDVRKEVVSRLRDAICTRGGVWINVAPAPAGFRTFLSLRFDHDRHDRDDLNATLAAIAGFENAASHFLSGAAHAGLDGELDPLRGCDVGSHGYWHHSYRDPFDAANNIGRGILLLAAMGFAPSGFVAPHGRFDRMLLAPLAEMGVTHSSEFGLACDDWPYFPDASNVLQIPVHPICLGICLEAAARQGVTGEAAADAVAEHFCQIAAAKRAAGEPLVFYGHPDGRVGKFPRVFQQLLGTVKGMNDVWPASFSQINRWWRARAELRLSIWLDAGRLTIDVTPPAPQWPMAIDIWQGTSVARHALQAGRQHIDLDSLALEVRAAVPQLIRQKAPPPTLKERWLRAIDWERETPLSEVRKRGWRGRMKRALRRIKPAWHEAYR